MKAIIWHVRSRKSTRKTEHSNWTENTWVIKNEFWALNSDQASHNKNRVCNKMAMQSVFHLSLTKTAIQPEKTKAIIFLKMFLSECLRPFNNAENKKTTEVLFSIKSLVNVYLVLLLRVLWLDEAASITALLILKIFQSIKIYSYHNFVAIQFYAKFGNHLENLWKCE